MSRYSHESFFFSQKKRPITLRVKKALDRRALSSKRRSTILKFRPQGLVEVAESIESESFVGNKLRSREGSLTSLPSALNPTKHVLRLPTIPSKGRHLTASLQPVEEAEEDPIEHFAGVSKRKLLSDLERAAQEQVANAYKFSELKFASTSILANLSKAFEEASTLEELLLPLSVVDIFGQNYYHLVADTIVEKREWQTDCYLELQKNQPFLTDDLEPEQEEELKENFERSLNIFAIIQIRERTRAARANRMEELQHSRHRATEKTERPVTAKSCVSVKSFESADIDWDKESIASRVSRAETEYDKLPAHLRLTGPPLLRFRRETTLPRSTLQGPGPMTRLEKFKAMASRQDKQKKVRPKLTMVKKPEEMEKEEQPPDQPPEGIVAMMSRSNISFTLTSSKLAEKGWIIQSSMLTDPEAYTLHQWAKNLLKENTRKREEAQMMAHMRGEDSELIVRYYSDPQNKMHQSRHQRSSTFPLPKVFSKLPPGLSPSIHAPSIQEDFFLGERQKLFLIVLPDKSGFCNYYNGQMAISFCRKGDGSSGLYTIVYDITEDKKKVADDNKKIGSTEARKMLDNTEARRMNGSTEARRMNGSTEARKVNDSTEAKRTNDSTEAKKKNDSTEARKMIGCFLPNGRGCCYYKNGSIRAVMDQQGGKLLGKEGNVTKKWIWPPNNERLPVSVVIELNPQVVFQCVGRTNMALRFSSHGQVHKLPVGLVPEALEKKPNALLAKNSDVSPDKLQSRLAFQSKAAKALESEGEPVTTKSVKSRGSGKSHSRAVAFKKQKSAQKMTSSVASMDSFMETDGPSQAWDEQYYIKDLDMYKNKFRDTVDEWLDHYRKIVGISAPSRRHTPIPSASQLSAISSHSLHSLSGTFSSSRPSVHSRSRSLAHSAMALDGRTGQVAEAEEVYPSVKPVSPLAAFIDRPKSHDGPRTLKVGPAQFHSRSPWQMKRGCPLLLHQTLLDKPPKVPLCRCDKHRIPLLRDLEFDEFLNSHIPSEQLVIVCVTSSKVREALPCEPLLNSIHYSRNRSRFSPCQQSFDDSFRILLYDLDRALDDLKLTDPLLLERHHAALGMFLMFMKGQLIGANTEFNGYGITKRDFLKQIQNSIDMGKKGHFLPQDFKLLPTKAGSKIHSRSLWAYPVSGVLSDFISCTPSVGVQSPASLPSSLTSFCSGGIRHPKTVNQLS